MQESEKWWFDAISDEDREDWGEEAEDFGVDRGIDYPATLRRPTTFITL